MSKRRIGIYGGTFNPPHIGHVEAARAFKKQMRLDELLIIPTFLPPHKDYSSSISCEDRLEMCRIAFSDVESASVSDMEIKRGGKSYTYLTLEELSSDATELFMFCGTDMLLTLDTWMKPERIFELASVCYIRRESDDATADMIERKKTEYKTKYGAVIYSITADVIDISSTEIRESRSARKYLPDGVLSFINERGLYGADI